MLPPNANGTAEMERAFMGDSAARAFDELIRLLRTDGPLWTTSCSEGFVLHRNAYERMFLGRSSYLRSASSNARFESSKHSGMVAMNAMQLVDMFLDSVRNIINYYTMQSLHEYF